jgi:LSD1 subclass zinc finger protein
MTIKSIKRSLLVITFLLMYLKDVESIRCYICNSLTNPKCLDTFQSSTIETMICPLNPDVFGSTCCSVYKNKKNVLEIILN